ncbi:MAG TPA: hypothetical protein DD727_01080 [Clostridiales bacterium]|nr:hypothetical protein [Clostridiales bacterium]
MNHAAALNFDNKTSPPIRHPYDRQRPAGGRHNRGSMVAEAALVLPIVMILMLLFISGTIRAAQKAALFACVSLNVHDSIGSGPIVPDWADFVLSVSEDNQKTEMTRKASASCTALTRFPGGERLHSQLAVTTYDPVRFTRDLESGIKITADVFRFFRQLPGGEK